MGTPTAPAVHARRTGQLLATALAALLLTGCIPEPGTPWVVDSVGFHGPRGNGQHYVTCIPKGAPNDYDRWREVAMPGPEDVDHPLDGKPCPDGPILAEYPPPR